MRPSDSTATFWRRVSLYRCARFVLLSVAGATLFTQFSFADPALWTILVCTGLALLLHGEESLQIGYRFGARNGRYLRAWGFGAEGDEQCPRTALHNEKT